MTLDRAAFVALQYHLAERGMLALRPQQGIMRFPPGSSRTALP